MTDLTGLGSVADLIKTGLDKIWPDKTEAEKQQATLLLVSLQGQLDTNKAEASNPNWFVAGWRPYLGWILGTGFGIVYVVGPMAEWIATLAGHPVKFPQLDMGTLMTLLGGMLGLGGLRTTEKIKGVEGNR